MNPTFYTPSEEPREPVLLPQSSIDPAETRRHFSKIGLAYLVLVAALMIAAYAMQYAALYLCPALFEEWWFSWAVSLVPLYGIGLPCLWLVLRKIPVSPHNPDFTDRYRVTAEKPRFGIGQWILLLVIAFGCMTAGSIVGSTVMWIMSTVMDYDYAFALNSMVDTTPVWFTFLCTCVCAPLGEELLFRKLLIDRTRRYGDLTAILLSGLLFGLFHGNLFQFFYAALVGMLMAYVYTRSGSYWWCVAMHAAINFMGSVVTPALAGMVPEDLAFTSSGQILAYQFVTFWQYGTLIAGIVLLCALFSRRKLSRGQAPLYRENGPSLVLLNVGMIACLAVMCLLVAVNLIPARS
ncbi:MAG: CPBP family intramembrane metalloprotease [Clostridia bacterium]|nr:CPBP family intramembrane metalloprotease [Clostridia bacterium]